MTITRTQARTKLFIAVSILSMTYYEAQGFGTANNRRSPVILPQCQGHPMDNVNYIMAPENSCMTAEGIMGVWACRDSSDTVQHSVCLPSIQGSVVGVPGDTCGCCGGECPTLELCECPCDGGVLVDENIFWSFSLKRCYPEGLAEALVGLDGDVSCHTEC
jgi:hypothetical protein